ncbi:hypothetical protein SCHPADRAFT_947981 [Schizopora paradoxa]|uniref:Uncharacterized protein n=1 Tax=Schizopora paradoxa TaxID=27342 RepID=A0A0H2R3M6_9AGAM|nr:hypothetical protein SCHPADRAFT_947981 [Schizopora paradoxa]
MQIDDEFFPLYNIAGNRELSTTSPLYQNITTSLSNPCFHSHASSSLAFGSPLRYDSQHSPHSFSNLSSGNTPHNRSSPFHHEFGTVSDSLDASSSGVDFSAYPSAGSSGQSFDNWLVQPQYGGTPTSSLPSQLDSGSFNVEYRGPAPSPIPHDGNDFNVSTRTRIEVSQQARISRIEEPPLVFHNLIGAPPPPSASLQKSTSDTDAALKELVWETADDRTLRAICPRCGEWINTGSVAINLGPVKSHLNGRKCRRKRDQAAADKFNEEVAKAKAARSVLEPLSGYHRTSNAPTASTAALTNDAPIRYSPRPEPPAALNPTVVSLQTIPCRGTPIKWPKGRKFYHSYPFQRHDLATGGVDYYFERFEYEGTLAWVRSKNCTHVGAPGGRPCGKCQSVEDDIERLARMSDYVPPHTNHAYRSHSQLEDVITSQRGIILQYRLEILALGRKLTAIVSILDDSRL